MMVCGATKRQGPVVSWLPQAAAGPRLDPLEGDAEAAAKPMPSLSRRRTPNSEYVRTLWDVEDAAHMLRESEEGVEQGGEELRDALHAAYAAEVPMTVLGRVVGVSRQRISAILNE